MGFINFSKEDVRELSNTTAETVGGNPSISNYTGVKLTLIPAVLLLSSFKPFKWLRLPAALMFADSVYTVHILNGDAGFRNKYGTGTNLK